MSWFFKKHPQSFLGIDIGTAGIRVVELSKHGEQEKLENYGYVSLPLFHSDSLKGIEKGTLVLSTKRIAELMKLLLLEAKIRSKKAVFSIPDFSTLFTVFDLPPMNEEEIGLAVQFEARRHVPLPLSEVTLDWLVTKGTPSSQKKERIEILLVVVPNRIIDQYTEIAELCGLQLLSLEAEVFSLQRALTRSAEDTVCLIDIGVQSTTCSIVESRILRISHSFDIGSSILTERISKALNIDYKEAEILKQNQGLMKGEQDVAKILRPLLGMILIEIKRVADTFYEREGRLVRSYIISGGSASLPGLKKYLSDSLEGKIKIINPFADMVYPSILEEELEKLGPGFSIAVGTALKGLEY